MVIINKKDGGDYARGIKKALFEKKDDYGKVKNMHLKKKNLFKILICCLIR